MLTAAEFYRDERVLRRILEYCGVPNSTTEQFRLESGLKGLESSKNLARLCKQMTAEYVAGSGELFKRTIGKKASSRSPAGLPELLGKGLNVYRSIWDRQSSVFVLDVEYVSHRFPAEAYHKPEEAGLPSR